MELSTAGVPAADRTAYWCDHVCAVFVELQVAHLAPAAPLEGRITAEDVDALRIATVSTTPQQVRRTRRLIAGSRHDSLAYGLLLRGRGVAVQDDREAVLTPGTGVFYDTTRPYTLHFDRPFTLLVALAPRSALGSAAAGEVCARALGADDPVAGLLGTFLRGLARSGPRLQGAERMRIGATAEALLATTTATLAGRGAPEGAARAAQRLRAERFVDRHLADPDLAPGDVAAALGVSVRYLHGLFHGEPLTVAALIRQRRLATARAALADPGQQRRSIAAIAAQCGFRDAGQLARAFRARYGEAPRDARGQHARA